MIKIWKGTEMEGPDIGLCTMFICSDVKIPPYIIYRLLDKHSDVKRLYFGAGRKTFVGIDKDWTSFVDYVLLKGITNINIEAQPDELHKFLTLYDNSSVNFICTYYNFPYISGTVKFKTDDTEKVVMHTGSTTTWLDTLNPDNLFANDVLLYEEE